MNTLDIRIFEYLLFFIFSSNTPRKKESTSLSCKKSYTDEELLAAVSEIQSGKLGTRRASVLYGIPRSTLRNKIFKMGIDKHEPVAPVSFFFCLKKKNLNFI